MPYTVYSLKLFRHSALLLVVLRRVFFYRWPVEVVSKSVHEMLALVDVSWYFTLLIAAILFLTILGCVLLKLTSLPHPVIIQYPEENFFLNPATSSEEPFPKLDDPHSVEISVIVPSYNEETRLPPMLDECLQFLHEKQKEKQSFKFEVIIVDDGSIDKTSEVGLRYSEKYSSDLVRVLTLMKNRGKGGAVRMGMLRARGKYLLFADADGATTFSDLTKLQTVMDDLATKSDKAVVVGSRAHLAEDSIAERSIFRTFLMYGFHFLVWLFTIRSIKDTQCGFKLITRRAARILFKNMHVERWAFDVELLCIAEKLNIPIKEIAVNWQEIEGSKIIPIFSYLQMGKDLVLIWLKYKIGAWRIHTDGSDLKD